MVDTSTWQELMDNAYDKWQDKMKYEEFLSELDTKEKHAVLLGNLNYQVQNGGFYQWVDNGYATNGQYLIEILQHLMKSPIALELAERLPDLLDFVDMTKKNRGIFGNYWLDGDDVPEEMMDDLTNWFYSVNDKFEEEVEEFLSR
jgi:hypothetical protein